jgi:uncharacterized protein (DUF302 family)
MTNDDDIRTIPASFTVAQAIDKVETALKLHGITIYARIDQRAEALKVGLSLNPLELLIFGNPKGGIPLIDANPLCALDLPLKILAWEDNQQKVWLSYSSFSYLQKRFDLPEALIQNIAGVEKIIQQALK